MSRTDAGIVIAAIIFMSVGLGIIIGLVLAFDASKDHLERAVSVRSIVITVEDKPVLFELVKVRSGDAK